MANNLRKTLIAALLVSATFVAAAPAIDASHCDPADPRCQHEQPVPKHGCFFTRTGGPGTPVTGGGAPGPQVLTLTCPNHIFLKADWGYKDCRGPPVIPECDPTLEPIVTDLGQSPDASGPCAFKHTWTVSAPNVNLFTFWMKVATFKDENCDGKADDWNAQVVGADGTSNCYWRNYFGPKPYENPVGMYDPYFAPPFGPTPDGVVNHCDMQIYETQWRQFN